MFKSENHIAIYVENREKAVEFYRDILGAEFLFEVDNESDGIRIAMMNLGNMHIELLEIPEDKSEIVSAAKATLNHFAINVDDIESAVDYIKGKGCIFEERGIYQVPCFGSPGLSLKVAFFHGINGERIELFQEIYS